MNKPTLKIAVAQVDNVLGDVDRNLERHYEAVEKAIEEKQDIIVFPELSLTGYSLKDAVYDVALSVQDAKWQQLKELSRHISIVVGAVELSDRYEIFNSLLFFEDGDLLSRHRKVYLPTYGLFEEKRYFSSGYRFRAFNSRLGRFGMLICEDAWHPTAGVILAQDGASIILVSAAGIARGLQSDGELENIQDWEALNRSLSIYTTSYIVFANRVGVEDGLMFWGGSEVYGPLGRRLSKAQYYEADLLFSEIDLLKLKHARINTTLLSDENLHVVIEELTRINEERKKY